MKNAKIFLVLIMMSTLLNSCGYMTEYKNSELYELTDYFVEQLETTYESYGLNGDEKHAKRTEDGKYRVMPFGRLINVKFE